MAARAGEAGDDRLHHVVAAGVWDAEPLETALLAEADRLVGAKDAFPVVDDTALSKKGRHSVGVAPHCATVLGQNTNCQTLVSLTLAHCEVPVVVGLRLFLRERHAQLRRQPQRSAGALLSTRPASPRS